MRKNKFDKVEVFGVIATVISVVGVILNNNRQIECFGFWVVSNLICAAIHAKSRLWSMMVRDLIFTVLAVDGIFRWIR